MPRSRLAALGLVVGALTLGALACSAAAQDLGVTPRPLSVAPAAGAPVIIGRTTRIVTPPQDAGAARTAAYLRGLLARTRGLTLSPSGARRGVAIRFDRAAPADLGAEGYRLHVGPGGVQISAASDAGLFYGAVTLWQLTTAEPGAGSVRLQPMDIVDHPRFAWRGLLLDSARHFQSPDFIERLIDWMALHKLNTLQWHLTDDQGWRLQMRRYPRLTSVGGWRPGIDRASGKPIQYGGVYTQAQVRRIVAYAAARHVTIVPEIEMPGHSLSAILAYPKLGAAPADPKTQGDWGIFPDILDPSDPTYAFMTHVLDETMALFPGPWINVGGDEAVKDEWRASPTVQAQLKRLGLADETALQGWFTARIGGYLAAHHRRMIGWDDILNGAPSLPYDAATVSWHADGAIKATSAGHDTVIATDPLLYLDHRQADLVGEPPGRGIVVSLQDVYGVEPVSPAMTPAEAAHIIGVQANLWTEHMPTEADVVKMAIPRAAALAEVGWTDPSRKDWADFSARLPAELRRDHALGLAPDEAAAEAPPPPASSAASETRPSQRLTLCSNKVALNLAGIDDAQKGQPFLVDIMNPCWIWPQADLDGRRLTVTATRLPYNFQLGADLAKVTLRAPTSPTGALEVRVDSCDAAPVLRLRLAPPPGADGEIELAGDLPALSGAHDLCLTFTQAKPGPLWVIASARLSAAGGAR